MVAMPEDGISVTSHSRLLIPSHQSLVTSHNPLFQTAPTKNNCQLTLSVIFSPWFP